MHALSTSGARQALPVLVTNAHAHSRRCFVICPRPMGQVLCRVHARDLCLCRASDPAFSPIREGGGPCFCRVHRSRAVVFGGVAAKVTAPGRHLVAKLTPWATHRAILGGVTQRHVLDAARAGAASAWARCGAGMGLARHWGELLLELLDFDHAQARVCPKGTPVLHIGLQPEGTCLPT